MNQHSKRAKLSITEPNNNTAQSRLKIEGNSDEFAEFNELHPNIIGYYCIDDGIFSLTAKHLKYLRSNYKNWTRRHKNFNLGDGIDTYKRKPGKGENDEKINFLLQWISEKKFLHEISGENANQEYYFVCMRGLLKTIMKTPFLESDDWCIDAVKVRNMIFLCVIPTEDDKKIYQKFKPNEYWGRKFEQCMQTDDPDNEPDLRTPLNVNKDFCLVFRAKINCHHLIYGGETDVLELDHKLSTDSEILNVDPSSFVELKTGYSGNRYTDRFRKLNLLNCWTQTYLSGIENVLWGFQNGKGRLSYIKPYKTSTLPNEAQNTWSPRVSQGFLEQFLNFVKTTMQNERDMTYYRFNKNARQSPDNFVSAVRMMPCPPECKIIPDWFEPEIKNFSNSFE